MYTRRNLVCAIAAALLPAILPAQEATLQVTGAVKKPLTFTAADLQKMPRTSAKAFEGVRLHEILKAAGVPSGSELRGKALSSYVLAEGQDGYQALFSLAELDPAFVESEVLIADTENGKPLAGKQGPFRLIAPNDKSGPRSVRMLDKIEVVQLRK